MPTATRLPPDARRRLRRLGWRLRRPLAALCAGLAVLTAVQQLRPPEPPTVPVAVAARDLRAGAVLAARDVTERAVPVTLVPGAGTGAGGPVTGSRGGSGAPGGSDRPGDLVGRRLAVAVPAGLPLVAALLVAEDADPPAGTVVVPVRFADPGVANVLRPGVRVDVVAAPVVDGGEAERLARGALVLAHPAAVVDETPDGDGLLGGGAPGTTAGGGDDVPVLLAVTPDESVLLGGSAGSRVLGAVIVG